jgi:hypothetical protein
MGFYGIYTKIITNHNHVLEKTMLSLIFAIPSWLCIMLGLQNQLYWVAAIGFGIALWLCIFYCTRGNYSSTH